MFPVWKQVFGSDYKSVYMGEKKWQNTGKIWENDYDGQWNYNQPFGNPNMITKIRKEETPMNFMTNSGSKTVDEVGEITRSGQTKSHPDMITNVLSLN